jgi:hypothetical protein
MLDPEEIVLCEHGNELDECRVCRGEIEAPTGSIFDVDAWAEAYTSEHPLPEPAAHA